MPFPDINEMRSDRGGRRHGGRDETCAASSSTCAMRSVCQSDSPCSAAIMKKNPHFPQGAAREKWIYLRMLEGFSFDEPWPKTIDAFELFYIGGPTKE
jgi:hypothetical protein